MAEASHLTERASWLTTFAMAIRRHTPHLHDRAGRYGPASVASYLDRQRANLRGCPETWLQVSTNRDDVAWS